MYKRQIWKYDPHWSKVFHLFEEILETLSDGVESMQAGGAERLFVNNTEVYPMVSLPYGSIPVHQLSSGMRRIIEIAYLVVWAAAESATFQTMTQRKAKKSITVIVDEIEIHLHPKWQRTVLPSLLKTVPTIDTLTADDIEFAETQFFITTHSPLVLSSIESAFDHQRDSVLMLDYDQVRQSVFLSPFNMPKLGSADAWLKSEVFGLSSSRSRVGEMAIDQARLFLTNNSKTSQFEIEYNLSRAIPDDDPFWVLWNLRNHISESRGGE